MTYNEIFTKLWNVYSSKNPSAKKIHQLFVSENEAVMNDHIAFRTFNYKTIGIDVLAKPFLKVGYKEVENYYFEEKKLHAKHYENDTYENAPRIFISELLMEEMSQNLQQVIKSEINKIDLVDLKSDDLIFKGNLWSKPKYETYQKLRNESEYAAWLYVYGFTVNHFTVSINSLKKYPTIEQVNQFLKDNGFTLNTSGGEIKGTKDMLLQQSSIMADIIEVDFEEGKYKIPACYYEFAIRYPDENGNLFSGFIAKSADKIFESTNYYQK